MPSRWTKIKVNIPGACMDEKQWEYIEYIQVGGSVSRYSQFWEKLLHLPALDAVIPHFRERVSGTRSPCVTSF